jgi:hypothetical protein
MRSAAVFTPAGESRPLQSNVSQPEALQLYEAVTALRPQRTLEIGFAHGISTLAILQALEDSGAGTHHVIDPFQARYDGCGLEMTRRAGLAPRMVFHSHFAEEVIPTLPELTFALIDSSHLFDLTLSEAVLVDKRLMLGGVMAFHDLWMPSQQAVIRYLLTNRRYAVWQSNGGAPVARPTGPLWKRWVRKLCACMPRAERIFRPDFLMPWNDLALGNLVFLEKRGADDRDWTFHRDF